MLALNSNNLLVIGVERYCLLFNFLSQEKVKRI